MKQQVSSVSILFVLSLLLASPCIFCSKNSEKLKSVRTNNEKALKGNVELLKEIYAANNRAASGDQTSGPVFLQRSTLDFNPRDEQQKIRNQDKTTWFNMYPQEVQEDFCKHARENPFVCGNFEIHTCRTCKKYCEVYTMQREGDVRREFCVPSARNPLYEGRNSFKEVTNALGNVDFSRPAYIILHGILSGCERAEYWQKNLWVMNNLGIYARCVEQGDGIRDSIMKPIDLLGEMVCQAVLSDPHMRNAPALILQGDSQGNLVGRFFMAYCNWKGQGILPPVKAYVAMGGPQMGNTNFMRYTIDSFFFDHAFDYVMQNQVSLVGWLRKPSEAADFKNFPEHRLHYLLNDIPETQDLPQVYSAIEGLDKMIVWKFGMDEAVSPQDSSLFCWWNDEGTFEPQFERDKADGYWDTVWNLTPQKPLPEVWKRMGLRTLLAMKKIDFKQINYHMHISYDEKLLQDELFPDLQVYLNSRFPAGSPVGGTQVEKRILNKTPAPNVSAYYEPMPSLDFPFTENFYFVDRDTNDHKIMQEAQCMIEYEDRHRAANSGRKNKGSGTSAGSFPERDGEAGADAVRNVPGDPTNRQTRQQEDILYLRDAGNTCSSTTGVGLVSSFMTIRI